MKTFIFCSLVVFVAGGSFLMFRKTKSSQVKTAISEYHAKKGQSINVKSVDFRLCSEHAPDSLNWLRFATLCNEKSDFAIQLLYSNGERSKIDSLKTLAAQYHAKADSITTKIRGQKGNKSFTRCNYIATITTNKEQFTDTLTVILNDKMKVVWPD